MMDMRETKRENNVNSTAEVCGPENVDSTAEVCGPGRDIHGRTHRINYVDRNDVFARKGATTTCDECGADVAIDRGWLAGIAQLSDEELEQRGGFIQVQNALCLNMAGGYGMFNDLPFDADPWMILCHDCSVKLYETFANATKRFGTRGLHPYGHEGSEPCCAYGWAFGKDGEGNVVNVEYGDGTSEPVTS